MKLCVVMTGLAVAALALPAQAASDGVLAQGLCAALVKVKPAGR